ncbi:Putative Mn2+ efflux pump MntP [Peptoniphilus asaccharolyticus DSM 20463]|uniref:Putative manganese efflux pump MntP n=1 Tax=Peptoniphilus asaccharolyticus DSM 20463 TaxID=573058 RepID=A0A1W1V9E5_PEPAS|nr:manganese efflux pump MntP family protein [Peptoniphilus asaccharolyticus]MBL7575784.1 manganese efflux pump [Peptoniphilus asaccharolyticus]SMB89948.1 Putative Mn2+ efflux pump MntP [Peptoniphilus asaccharolyticus DSM 20463]
MESILSISIIGVGLAMDAFAASICKGLTLTKRDFSKIVKVGVCFGFFQAIMPVLGFLLASTFADKIKSLDHWIAFLLLSYIGINMIKESRIVTCDIESGFDFKSLTLIGIATSIDAMAVGISFAFLNVEIYSASILIGLITFIISMLGVTLGNIFGIKYKQAAEFAGGIILIAMGIKILIEHLFFLK